MKYIPNIGFKPFLLICLIIGLCYSNTLNASWQLDDYYHIVQNPKIHLNKLNFNSLTATFFTGPDNQLYRALPCLSFALNWYFGADNVFGYHIINIAVHIITAFMLFLSLTLLLKAPKLIPELKQNAYSISLLAAVLWAVHPIQTQAVTYIVQRMALMAAMFYIIGLFFYIKARLSPVRFKRIIYYSCSLMAYAFALLSKENAVMMPLSVLLLEIIFFSGNLFFYILKRQSFKKILLITGIVLIFIQIFLFSDILHFLNKGYDGRLFTLAERLLTEPRIILKYIFQIFYPVSSIYSIEHDVSISTSLLTPWTTIPAILINVAIIAGAIIQYKKMPLLSFAILFFYVNHIVESTVIPLELIFEHRNYLPTLFLFVPISYGIIFILNNYKRSNSVICQITFAAVTFLIFTLCICTFTRNRVWATEKGLWEDVLLKYPGLSRPYQKIAEYYKSKGYDDLAFKLYEKALPLKHQRLKESRYVCYNNMGNIYVAKGEYWKALDLYRKAIPLNNDQNTLNLKYYDDNVSSVLYNMAYAYLKADEWKESEILCDRLIQLDSQYGKALELKGFILIEQGRIEESMPYLERAMSISPTSINVLLYTGYAFMQNSEFNRSLIILQKAHTLYPNDMVLLFCIVENCSKSNEHSLAEKYTEILFNQFTLTELKQGVDDFKRNDDPARLSMPVDGVSKAIADYLIKKSKKNYSLSFLK